MISIIAILRRTGSLVSVGDIARFCNSAQRLLRRAHLYPWIQIIKNDSSWHQITLLLLPHLNYNNVLLSKCKYLFRFVPKRRWSKSHCIGPVIHSKGKVKKGGLKFVSSAATLPEKELLHEPQFRIKKTSVNL